MQSSPPRTSNYPSGAKDYRAYVIGDVHGRLDLLENLLAKIHVDLDRKPAPRSVLVFVGDLIDRGPNSAQVLERLRGYWRLGVQPVFLLGNHEEVLLRIIGGEAGLVASWLQFGGLECLESYGVEPVRIRSMTPERAVELIQDAIPASHVAFLENFSDSCRFGDYLFVHAGIRPGIALDHQLQSDLRWIRAPFLSDDSDHGFVVVHGHTITREVDDRANRIGIDTGAYRTGILTALAIEGDQRWYLDTQTKSVGALSDAINLGTSAE